MSLGFAVIYFMSLKRSLNEAKPMTLNNLLTDDFLRSRSLKPEISNDCRDQYTNPIYDSGWSRTLPINIFSTDIRPLRGPVNQIFKFFHFFTLSFLHSPHRPLNFSLLTNSIPMTTNQFSYFLPPISLYCAPLKQHGFPRPRVPGRKPFQYHGWRRLQMLLECSCVF